MRLGEKEKKKVRILLRCLKVKGNRMLDAPQPDRVSKKNAINDGMPSTCDTRDQNAHSMLGPLPKKRHQLAYLSELPLRLPSVDQRSVGARTPIASEIRSACYRRSFSGPSWPRRGKSKVCISISCHPRVGEKSKLPCPPLLPRKQNLPLAQEPTCRREKEEKKKKRSRPKRHDGQDK